MKSNKYLRILVILLILAVNIGCDQASKSYARHRLYYFNRIELLHDHITLVRVENTGAFLSAGDSMSRPMKLILLNLVPLLVVIGGLFYIIIKPNLNRMTLLGILLVIGGGAGNLYDRVFRGSVTDFMHIDFVIFQTGIFNVADMSITAGAVIILLQAWRDSKKNATDAPDAIQENPS